jgi:hypothetical protein
MTGAKLDTCFRMAPLLKVNPYWLFDGSGKRGDDSGSRVIAPPEETGNGMVLRSYPEILASMRPGQVVPSDRVPFEQVTLSLDWVQEHLPRDRGNDLVRVNGRGDSMEPYFHDGDLLICNIGFDRKARLKPGAFTCFASMMNCSPSVWNASPAVGAP